MKTCRSSRRRARSHLAGGGWGWAARAEHAGAARRASVEGESRTIDLRIAQEVASGTRRRFDKGGDQFYDQISALHQARCAGRIRTARCTGSAACSMVAATRSTSRGGWCGWRSRTLGLADPRAFEITLNAWEAYDRLGSPEGSWPSPTRWCFSPWRPRAMRFTWPMGEAKADVEQFGTLDVPARFRNARRSS